MQTLGTSSRVRGLMASGLAVVLVGGGVAASQFLAADASAPLVPAATISAPPSPAVPTAVSTVPATGSSTEASASETPSPTPTPTPGFYCKVTDAQIKELHPEAQPQDRDGSRYWYENDQMIGVTHEGVGRVDPCSVS